MREESRRTRQCNWCVMDVVEKVSLSPKPALAVNCVSISDCAAEKNIP